MKKILLLPFLLFFAGILLAQAPQGLNYQGIARNAAGNPYSNQPVQVRLSLREGTPNGTLVYSEERTVTTNAFGLFSLQIGAPGASNVQGSFGAVNWAAGSKFLQTEIRVGAAPFSDLGTTQLMSVPYAISSLQSRQLQFPFDTTVNSNNAAAFALKNTSAAAHPAIQAESVNGPGFVGVSTNNNGVAGYSAKAGSAGVFGSTSVGGGCGVSGTTVAAHATSAGVYGSSANGHGVRGQTSNGTAVMGQAVGTGSGVMGTAKVDGIGVAAYNPDGWAMRGLTVSGIGVVATAASGDAIRANANGTGFALYANQSGAGTTASISNSGTGTALTVNAVNNEAVEATNNSFASPAAKLTNNNANGYALRTSGKLNFSGGDLNPGAGKVLTSDGAGNATWQPSGVTPKIAFKLSGILSHGLNNYAPNNSYRVFFNNEDYDFGNTVSVGSTTANSIFTAPVAGVYHFDCAVQLDADEGGINAIVSLVKITAGGSHQVIVERLYSETAVMNPDGISARPNFMASSDVQLAGGERVYCPIYWRNGEENNFGYTGMYPTTILDDPRANVFSGHLVFAL